MSVKTARRGEGSDSPGNSSRGAHTTGLEVRDLTITYETEAGPLDTVRNVSLNIDPGEIYGLVGESGSGKTTLARGVVRYLPGNGRIKSGSVHLEGTDLLKLKKAEIRRVWGRDITMVHQDPNKSVNPSMPVGDQIAEMARVHLGLPKLEARRKAVEMLTQVRMSDPATVARRYAHQLSGGQLQRVLIAIALTTNPRLLIMDEPTTALDVTTEAVILDLVRDLLAEYQTAVLYITHNLGVVARLCHRVGVIYAGEMMEQGPLRGVFKEMLHPYTLGLLGSVPRVDVDKRDIVLNTIPGYIPQPDDLPAGCIFAPRCLGAEQACRAARPPLVAADGGSGHLTACRRWQTLRRAPQEFTTIQQRKEFVEPTTGDVVLEAKNVKKYFPVSRVRLWDLLRGRRPVVRAVDDISVRVRKSFTMGIVGESGCGKTTFARCVAGLEKATAGEILLEKKKLPPSVAKRPVELLKKIQMVFQNPDASLNPQATVGSSVARPLALLRHLSKGEIRRRVEELFEAVNLPNDYIARLPHEISGGEKQRVAIARAFATDPTLMICDEPISSLDVSVQASLMNLLSELQETKGTSYLFISHDLAAVRHLSDWIAVIYLGRLWEIGSALEVFAPPQHPYTEALLSALPIPDPDAKQHRIRLHGNVPSSVDIPGGCRFHPRCPRKIGEICEQQEPPWQEHGRWHRICCHIPLEELIAKQRAGGR
ncbi:MAG: ABC transporter ATP-binding protein [Spirochaetaceae bacterium]|nr:MAG: ABC transporter ATP-binding protein [Spirochaetaceae bacterium]